MGDRVRSLKVYLFLVRVTVDPAIFAVIVVKMRSHTIIELWKCDRTQ
ncbi:MULTISPECIES: hypothetical protein [Nostocales]|uniref:Uncharacterized protein n=1 Tax=Aphanizomenon flos-aquae FACHB-1040 TaxID=2692887 RepID=A0ABR8BRG9_APHFL|nr:MULTISPECIES: hypothetical protein [Nostocales]MBD2277382.1 hypothetical protein [Aphanizomenon flos-aquae FACHB-1040]